MSVCVIRNGNYVNIFATFINLSSDRVSQRALKIVMHEMINGAFEKQKFKQAFNAH